MSYDNRDAYPQGARPVKREQVGKGYTYDDDTLKDRVLDALRSAKSDMDTLNADRAKYMRYYMGDEPEKKVESGRSSVVMSDVADVIEGVMPSMMRIFYGSEKVLQISPIGGPDDELKAKLMEEKVNFDIKQQNDGFKLLYTFIKDALLQKMGVVKYWWEKRDITDDIAFEGLTPDELMMLMQNDRFILDSVKTKIVSLDGKEIEADGEGNIDTPVFEGESVTYNVKGKVIRERISRPVYENLPPEDFIFNINARSLKEGFAAHRKKLHKNKLKSRYNLTDEDIEEEQGKCDTAADAEVLYERYRDLGMTKHLKPEDEPGMYYIYECYINDHDEDGELISKKVVIFGERVLEEEENSYGEPPFCIMSPILIQHRIIGRGLSELLLDVQRLHTALVRYTMDNIYFQNNQMRIVNPFRIDVDTLLDANRPGGVAFTSYDTDPGGAVKELPVTPLPPHIMQLMEYVEGPIKENRTGVTRYNQGIDANSLNKTATGITSIMNAAQQRIELMARILAETGIRHLYQSCVKMNIDYYDIDMNLKINDNWQMLRPEMIDGKFDISIEVGSATGRNELKYQQKMQMLQTYGMLFKTMGPQIFFQTIASFAEIRNITRSMWEDLGYKNVDKFVLSDSKVGTQPPMLPMMQPQGGNNGAGGTRPGPQGRGNQQRPGGGNPSGPPPNLRLLQGPGGQVPGGGMPMPRGAMGRDKGD